jgi:hypothetical protein
VYTSSAAYTDYAELLGIIFKFHTIIVHIIMNIKIVYTQSMYMFMIDIRAILKVPGFMG